MGISGMGEDATPFGAVIVIVVDGVEFEVNAIPHVVEVGDVSTKNVDDDVFEVVGPERDVFHCIFVYAPYGSPFSVQSTASLALGTGELPTLIVRKIAMMHIVTV
jgi:hypothetical protein